jgi:hypothetical protein
MNSETTSCTAFYHVHNRLAPIHIHHSDVALIGSNAKRTSQPRISPSPGHLSRLPKRVKCGVGRAFGFPKFGISETAKRDGSIATHLALVDQKGSAIFMTANVGIAWGALPKQ